MRKITLKKTCMVLLTVLIIIVLSGCYDSAEIDDKIFTFMLGVDKGQSDNIIVTVIFPSYEGGKGGDDKGNQNFSYSIEAPSIQQAIDMLSYVLPRKVSLMHTKIIIFSQQLAESGIMEHVFMINKNIETRGTMGFLVTNGSAREYIEEEIKNDVPNISKNIELQLLQSKLVSYYPDVNFNKFLLGLSSPYGQAIALYGGIRTEEDRKEGEPEKSENPQPPYKDPGTRDEQVVFNYSNVVSVSDTSVRVLDGKQPGGIPVEGNKKSQITGIAIFKDDRMVGFLDSHETIFYMLAAGKFDNGTITLRDADMGDWLIEVNCLSNSVNGIKTDIRPDGKVHVSMELNLKATVESFGNSTQAQADADQFCEFITEQLTTKLNQTIKKTQQLDSDILNLGSNVAKKFSTIQQWEKFNWAEGKYRDAVIDVKINFDALRVNIANAKKPYEENYR